MDYLSDLDAILQVKSLHCKLDHLPFDVISEVIQPIEFLTKEDYNQSMDTVTCKVDIFQGEVAAQGVA